MAGLGIAYFALCNIADRYAVVTGGVKQGTSDVLNQARRYDLRSKTWEDLPRMKVARQAPSSCVLDGTVFVFCGIKGGDETPLSSVEMLTDAGASLDLIEGWRLITIPEATLSPRWMPGVAPLNSEQIVVMGGIGIVDDETSCLGDVVIFDAGSGRAERVVPNFGGILQFVC